MSESESEVAQSYLTLSNPMDCSLPGSSVHGIFHARVLEWSAIALTCLNSEEDEVSLFERSTALQGAGEIPRPTSYFMWV